ncbi:CrcB family protein [Actibacterium sp. 188UL27-1]|uniref:fluoride efflux transporter FluC n=1 Tax=Actibacterium sp. 188UL27-1 TaxID=2786961 RepID=UPI00195D3E2C|nr:CrcB family protein [Actibacterium sp. 188UL27-1]MBM7069972.1 CrcB family protein [Actibacterium sp. 188UL27-1]
MNILLVALGGALGAVLRYLTTLAVAFPFGTLTVNVVGSFLMGVFLVLLAERGLDRWIPLVMSGILGGFTTFSAFSLDTIRLFEDGRPMEAGAYAIGTVLLSLIAIFAAIMLTRALTV